MELDQCLKHFVASGYNTEELQILKDNALQNLTTQNLPTQMRMKPLRSQSIIFPEAASALRLWFQFWREHFISSRSQKMPDILTFTEEILFFPHRNRNFFTNAT